MISISSLPSTPGCYLFKNKRDKVIYVGKAKNLKKRVKSYFQKTHQDEKTQALVGHIRDVDFISTDTEIEALILENTLINKHFPKYNIRLKDTMRYAYLQITDEPFPRLLTARTKTGKGTFFGPFTSGTERVLVQETLIKTFKIRTCKRLPKRACLRYHINLCDAPCIDNISQQDYYKQIQQAEMVLKGKTGKLASQLKEKMHTYAEEKQYEQAMILRDQSSALEYLDQQQKMERQKSYNEDIINYIVKDNVVYVMLFHIYKGTLTGKQEFVFDYMEGFLENFISQYYNEFDVPKEVIIPQKIDPLITDFLTYRKGSKVKITLPKIGEKKKLLKLVKKNIELTFFGNVKKVEALKKDLKLNFSPSVIECFDISHLSGTNIVGSMVQFRNGKPDKNNYRRFKLRTVADNDDFASMAEVVKRRYLRLQKEQQRMPDLVLIDGGKGQLSVALDELRQLGVKIPIIAIAKKFEELYVPGRDMPIRLDKKSKALHYLQEIRDEAHRFAIKYQKLLRSKQIHE